MNNLRNLRKKKGYSIQQLHEMTGIPFRTLQDWDGEKRQIQAYHRIKMLSELLGTNPDDLMTKEENCLYNGENAVITMIQEEQGVNASVFVGDDLEPAFNGIIPREDALELLTHIKQGKDIKPFLH